MFWMDSLPSQYSPDIITTNLTAGTTYTFELSRNFAEFLGGRIPDINIAEYTDEVNAAASGTPTQINARVLNVLYVDEYALGTGLIATTNLQPLNETALEEFTLKAPAAGEKIGRTLFNYSFISSKEEYQQRIKRNFKVGLATDALGISAGVQSASNLKCGLTSTTLVIHYE